MTTVSDNDQQPPLWGRTNMTEEEIDRRVRALVDKAPPLSDAQRTSLAELLRPIREKYRDEYELVG